MAVNANEIGYDGQTIRPYIQTLFDNIDIQLLDPKFILTAINYATPAQKQADPGIKVYEFRYPGQLNAAEESALTSDWGSATGWDNVEIFNTTPKPGDVASQLFWVLRLTLIP